MCLCFVRSFKDPVVCPVSFTVCFASGLSGSIGVFYKVGVK